MDQKSQYPKVTIIILNWNGLDDTVECLDSVKKLKYLNYEVIIIDNASTDGSFDIIRKLFPEHIYLQSKYNMGYTGGNNMGMKYAYDHKTDYVWLLNNDTIVDPHSLNELIEGAESNCKIGLISPIVYSYSKPEEVQFCGAVIDRKDFTIKYSHDPDSIKQIHGSDVLLWGTALLIKAHVIKSIGYLDDRYFAYWEDNDYSIRSVRAGFTNIIVKSAKIFHKEGIKGAHYYFYMIRNEYFFWMQRLGLLNKLRFIRQYLWKNFEKIGVLRDEGRHHAIDPMVDGLYCAIVGISGSRGRKHVMPSALRGLIKKHPFLLTYITRGDFKTLIFGCVKKLKIIR